MTDFADAHARAAQAAADRQLADAMFGVWPEVPRVERAEQCGLGLPGSIDAEYAAWRQTPDGQVVYAAIVDRALGLVAAGATRLSTKALVEWARATLRVRINNDATACLARELVDTEPEIAELIEMRQRRAAA